LKCSEYWNIKDRKEVSITTDIKEMSECGWKRKGLGGERGQILDCDNEGIMFPWLSVNIYQNPRCHISEHVYFYASTIALDSSEFINQLKN
jgi:hypothetical protein